MSGFLESTARGVAKDMAPSPWNPAAKLIVALRAAQKPDSVMDEYNVTDEDLGDGARMQTVGPKSFGERYDAEMSKYAAEAPNRSGLSEALQTALLFGGGEAALAKAGRAVGPMLMRALSHGSRKTMSVGEKLIPEWAKTGSVAASPPLRSPPVQEALEREVGKVVDGGFDWLRREKAWPRRPRAQRLDDTQKLSDALIRALQEQGATAPR
jgi:hypothetical protein